MIYELLWFLAYLFLYIYFFWERGLRKNCWEGPLADRLAAEVGIMISLNWLCL